MPPAAPLAFEVDTSALPLLRIAATAAVRDDAALERTYAALDVFTGHAQGFVLLIDARGAVSTPKRRARMKGWIKQNQAWLDRHLLGTAIVVGTPVERGFVTAALWFVKSRTEIRVFQETDRAREWLFSVHAQR